MAKTQTTPAAPAPAAEPTKSACPIDRATFNGNAKPQTVNIAGQSLIADVKEFSSGSFGWYSNGKIVMEVNGVPCKVQVGVTLTVVGSRDTK